MKVGDLVKIKYDGVIGLIIEVETIQTYSLKDEFWIRLLNQPVPFKPETLEVINESR